MDGSKRRLDRLELVLKRQRDPIYTVKLKDGSEVTCTFEQAWDYFKSDKGHMVESVAVDRSDYIENAALLEILCKS